MHCLFRHSPFTVHCSLATIEMHSHVFYLHDTMKRCRHLTLHHIHTPNTTNGTGYARSIRSRNSLCVLYYLLCVCVRVPARIYHSYMLYSMDAYGMYGIPHDVRIKSQNQMIRPYAMDAMHSFFSFSSAIRFLIFLPQNKFPIADSR